MPGVIMLDSVARPFGPDSLLSSTGSLISIGDSTTRLPSASNALMVVKAPCGTDSSDHGISVSCARSSSMP